MFVQSQSGNYQVYDSDTKNSYTITGAEYQNDFSKKTMRKVSIYQYEFELNEAKRDIVIIEGRFLQQITNELNNIF